jgi:hypothetical protein
MKQVAGMADDKIYYEVSFTTVHTLRSVYITFDCKYFVHINSISFTTTKRIIFGSFLTYF